MDREVVSVKARKYPPCDQRCQTEHNLPQTLFHRAALEKAQNNKAHGQGYQGQEHIKLPFNTQCPERPVDLLVGDAARLHKEGEKECQFLPVDRLKVLPVIDEDEQEQASIVRRNDAINPPQVETTCRRPRSMLD